MAERKEVFRVGATIGIKENMGGLILQGILSNFEERTQKDGKPYVVCTLSEKEYELPCKMFSTSKADFLKTFGLEDGKSSLVQISGDYQIYQDEPGLVIKAVDSHKAVIVLSEDPTDYICTSVYPVDVMKAQIKGIVTGMKDPLLKAISIAALKMMESEDYFPYSPKIHPEKGGNLQFHYNVIQRIICRKSVDCRLVTTEDGKHVRQENFNDEICIAALLAHNTGVYERIKCDALTGKVLEENEAIKCLYGKVFEAQRALLLSTTADEHVKKQGGKIKACFRENYEHTVCAALKLIDIATKEAEVLTSCMDAEFLDSKYTYVKRGTPFGGIGHINIDGSDRKLVNI